MARDFDGSGQYLEFLGTPPVTGYPFTMSCWVNMDAQDESGFSTWMAIGDKDTDLNYWDIRWNGATDFLAVGKGGVGDNDPSGGSLVTGTDIHVCGVFDGVNMEMYDDGSSNGPTAFAVEVENQDAMRIGSHIRSPGGGDCNGRIWEAAVWSAGLTAREVNALARGMSPLLVRPSALVSYWPLFGRQSPEPDIVGGFNMTLVGGPGSATQGRVYFPIPGFASIPARAAIRAPVDFTALNASPFTAGLPSTDFTALGPRVSVLATAGLPRVDLKVLNPRSVAAHIELPIVSFKSFTQAVIATEAKVPIDADATYPDAVEKDSFYSDITQHDGFWGE